MRTKMDDSKKLEIKQNIIDSTIEIIEKEGFDAISIRKVAALSNYTAGNIYQYFENKEHLIRETVKFGYLKIIKAISIDLEKEEPFENKIRNIFISYTKNALLMGDYYKAVMLSEDPKLLKITSVLNNDLDSNKKAITILEDLISKGMDSGEFVKGNHKLYAKIIWTSLFGLIIRLIIENQRCEEVVNALLNANFDLMFSGLKNRGIN